MFHIIILLLLISVGTESLLCFDGSYLNLCGICVGGRTGLGELEGLDRCMVCGGKSSCVGCDGIVNSEYKKDLCGMCLKPLDERWNDCKVITSIYPRVTDMALKNNLIAMTVRGAGLDFQNDEVNAKLWTVVGEEGQEHVPVIVETSSEDNDIELMVEVGLALGLYRVSCSGIDGSAVMRIVNSLNWDTISVSPNKLHVDSVYQMEMQVKGERSGMDPVLCVIRCNESPSLFKRGRWKGENSVICQDFTPRFAGWCEIGITASEDAGRDTESSGAFVKVAVATEPPHILSAEYNQDLGKLMIRFKVNIQLSASCEYIFSQASLMSLNASECQTSGDLLVVGLQPEHPLLPAVDIIPGNGICRVGSAQPDLSPECYPVAVPVSRQKVLPPNLSLQVPSVMCHSSEELRVSTIGKQRLDYYWSVPPPSIPTGSQRENLLTWRNVRELEQGLNNKKGASYANLYAAKLLPEKSYKIQVRGTNALGEERMVSSALVYSPAAPATVIVSAPPAVTSLLAEVKLTMCSPSTDSFHFKWFLNEQYIPGGGRMILMGNLKPGIYNISCIVSLYHSREVIAGGWVLTQVLPSERKALLSPAKQVISTMDSAVIRAYLPLTGTGNVAVWRCLTPPPESLPCLEPGPNIRRVDQTVVNNFATLNIPSGVLPVGRYIWRLENVESTEAEIEVRDGKPPLVIVNPIPPQVNPRKPLLLHGESHRLDTDCTVRWTTAFQLGFNYFNLEEDVGLGDSLQIQYEDGDSIEFPLAVPSSQGDWKGLMSEASYLLRLIAECPDSGVGYADVPVIVNVPPSVGPIAAMPNSGTALATLFIVSSGFAYDIMDDYPLRFIWSVHINNEEIIPIATGASPRSISLFLPPGEINISLNVCDIHATCTEVTSDTITVTPSSTVSKSVIDSIEKEITDLIVEGSIIEGIGKSSIALIALKSHIQNEQGLKQFQEISDVTEAAISVRTNDLIQELGVEPLLTATALDFIQEVFIVLKYLEPNNKVLDSLNKLKDGVTDVSPNRRKRDLYATTSNKNEMLSSQDKCGKMLDFESQSFSMKPTEDSKTRILSSVKNCMIQICSSQGDVGSLIDTTLVKLWISGKLSRSRAKKKISAGFKNWPSVEIASPPTGSKCLAIAKLDGKIFETSESITSVDLRSIYEIQFVANSSLLNLTSHDPLFEIYLPKQPGNGKQNCLHWDSLARKWTADTGTSKAVGDSVVCKGRWTGYISLSKIPSSPIPTSPPDTTTMTTMKTVPPTTTTTTTTTTETTTHETVSTSAPAITAEPGTTRVFEAVPTTTVQLPTVTKQLKENATGIESTGNEFDDGIKVESVVRETIKGKSFIGGGRFIIDEDYNNVIDDLGKFKKNVTAQLAIQLDVMESQIFVTAKEGSIVLSVYFAMDMEPHKALTVLGHLVNLVKNDELSLEHNGKQLNIPKQNLTLVITPEEISPKVYTLQTATFVVAGIAVVIAVVMVIIATRGKPPSNLPPRRRSRVEDSSPCYLDLQNDFSLDGSSESLAQFRRPSLWSEK